MIRVRLDDGFAGEATSGAAAAAAAARDASCPGDGWRVLDDLARAALLFAQRLETRGTGGDDPGRPDQPDGPDQPGRPNPPDDPESSVP